MSRLSVLVSLMMCIFLSACTTKNLYNAVQENRLFECNQMQGLKKDECIVQYNKSYEEYTEAKEGKITPDQK